MHKTRAKRLVVVAFQLSDCARYNRCAFNLYLFALCNETNVVFGMSVPFLYKSVFFEKNGFFLFLFVSVCGVYKYDEKYTKK